MDMVLIYLFKQFLWSLTDLVTVIEEYGELPSAIVKTPR